VIPNRFAGKVALVTGAASGIGEATAKRFAAEGATVVVVDLNADGAARVVHEIGAAGGHASAFRADVAAAADAEAMIRHAVTTHGRLDILHNNATSGDPGLIADLPVASWERTLAVNLTAPFLATKFALPVMIAQGGGAIVNMSSGAGVLAEEGLAAYGAAKAGVINLTRSTAIEYARYGVRANCVCPGAVDTPPRRALANAVEGAGERFARAAPLGRLGTPGELAAVILFLASDDASFVTGATYFVDGGALATKGVGLFGSP
jgi:meso-butanediol dehydrogenase/(S,S)-butanediol dehydrogenase/diacetyl reductase